MRSLLLLSAASVAVVVVLLSLVWLGQRRMYFPFGHVPAPADVGLPDAEPVDLPTADGLLLRAWYVAAMSAGPHPSRRFTMIVCNGNAGNRAYRADLARAFAAQGVAVLLFDYRGFGDSEGSPHEAGLYTDSRAARDWLMARRGVDALDLVYFGESLGAAVAIDLAAAHPPGALVLRSPFTSMTDVARFHYPMLPVGLLLRDRFSGIERIGEVRAPLLVIAGDRDGIVPMAQSRRLYDAAREPKTFVRVDGADHNDHTLTSGPSVISATMRVLAEVSGADAPS